MKITQKYSMRDFVEAHRTYVGALATLMVTEPSEDVRQNTCRMLIRHVNTLTTSLVMRLEKTGEADHLIEANKIPAVFLDILNASKP